MRELRATLLRIIDDETRGLQAEEWDEDVRTADFWMKAAVARHLDGLPGADYATTAAALDARRAAIR